MFPRLNDADAIDGTDSSELGFKVCYPDDYQLIPPDPNEGNIIAKFDPKTVKYVLVGGSDPLFLHTWLVRFDASAPKTDKGKEPGKKIDLSSPAKRGTDRAPRAASIRPA